MDGDPKTGSEQHLPQSQQVTAWVGAGVFVLAGVVLLTTALLRKDKEPSLTDPAQQVTEVLATATTFPPFLPMQTVGPSGQAVIDREILPLPSDTPHPTPTPTVTPPVIEWSQAEKYALSWLCYGEVGGMQEVKVDACLSVISTVRARYAYYNAFGETTVLETLMRPGQFNISIRTDIPSPDPDLNWTVELYVAGARGACTGYLYFNSVPGGPSECVIRASNGQWVEFHNGW